MPDNNVVFLLYAAKAAINRVLPNLPNELIVQSAIHYQISREHEIEAPAKVRASMQKVADQAAALYLTLGALSKESRHSLRVACEPADGEAFLRQADFVTSGLMGMARNAAKGIDPKGGRPNSARHALIRSFAHLLGDFGYEANASENGNLCFLTREVLTALGEVPADVRALVRDALGKTTANKPSFAQGD